MGSNAKTDLGGSTGNAVRTMVKLGEPTIFMSVVGEDPCGKRYCEEMHQMGFRELSKILIFTTIRILCLATPDGEDRFSTFIKIADGILNPRLSFFKMRNESISSHFYSEKRPILSKRALS